MAILSITVDAELLERARQRAADQGTSLGAILRQALEHFVESDSGLTAGQRIAKFAEENPGDSGGWKWNRDELYKERMDKL